MNIAGSYNFGAPRDRVWTLLMDPQVIASCIPGCEGFEPIGEDQFRARLKVALAAIAGSYDGTIVMSNKVPLTSYTLTADGQGRPGFVKGTAAITLRDGDDTGTVVDVNGTVQTGGPVARVGQRLIGSVSKMMMDRFFACLQGKL
jgi:carbon monoxide dehydrogenase subunit G